MKPYRSWGRYPQSCPAQVYRLSWRSEVPDLNQLPRPILPYGNGRSYGDCCLNDGGILLDSSGLDRFIRFDRESGILQCEAGVSLQSVLQLILPRNWFLPVTPGTQYITVGGAIANDVHGKNHHRAGSFGCHVRRFELLRSDRGKVLCSRQQNQDLFEATIGGLGLTGLILWAEFQLKRVPGPLIDYEQIRFRELEEFFELSAASDASYEYTAAWLDCISPRYKQGRGFFMRGDHSSARTSDSPARSTTRSLYGFNAPEILINGLTMRAFNWLVYHGQLRDIARKTVRFEKFFYPLDRIDGWNRLYGRRGFIQYQFVVPNEKKGAVREILDLISESREVCTLAVLKVFGPVRSIGLLSFPRPGVTVALDFPFRGRSTLDLCEQFDRVVSENGGAVYPAKDARMSRKSFQEYFPRWIEFLSFLDPRFESDLWRRVGATR